LSGEPATHPSSRRLLERLRSFDPRLVAVGGALIGGLVVLVAVLALGASGVGPPRLPGAGADGVDLESLKRGTVLISGEASNPTSWGSGTIISSDGLILTNAHVAENRAPGLGVLFKGPPAAQLGAESPEILHIYTVDGDEPAIPTWQARVVVADGYLDLAVLQVIADSSGRSVAPDDLNLPAVPLGTSHNLAAGAELSVLGFPVIAQSARIHVTRGVLSNFSDDARIGEKGWINTDAKISPGNSGGLGAHEGKLVGIPDRREFEASGGPEIEYIMRPVELAFPLIEAARAGTAWDPYSHVVRHSGAERATVVGWSSTPEGTCTSSATDLAVGPTTIEAQIQLTNMVPGDHLYVTLFYSAEDGSTVEAGAYPLDWGADAGSEGCLTAQFSAAEPINAGAYTVGLLAGANYEYLVPLDGAAVALVGSGAPTGEGPVDTGNVGDRACAETDPDRWATSGAAVPTPEMPFPVNAKAPGFAAFWEQLTPAGGVDTLEEADTLAVAALTTPSLVTNVWFVLEVGDRYHAYAGTTWSMIGQSGLDDPKVSIGRPPACVIDPAIATVAAFHGKAGSEAATYRFDSLADGTARITDMSTGELVWPIGTAPVEPTPEPTPTPAGIPSTPGPQADAWLLERITARSGTVGCQTFDLRADLPPGVVSLAACTATSSYDTLIYYLFADRVSMNAYVTGQRAAGNANAQQVCGSQTWAYSSSVDVDRGALLCGAFDAGGGPIAQITWTEDAFQIAGIMENATTGGDIAALWEAWKTSGVFEAPP
jgi:S1-C subfamily serine protease